MRVAMLSVHTSPLATLGGKDTGGMNVYVRELSRELGRQGIAVDIFTRSQDASTPRQQEPWPRVRVIQIPAGPETPYDRRRLFAYMPEFVQGVSSFAAADGVAYDLVHSHYWLSGWVALELQRERRLPVVQMFHTLGHLKNRVASDAQSREAQERTRVEAAIMRRADCIVAATPADRNQMVELYGADPAKIAIVPPGVDLELFRPIPRSEARRYVGLADEDERLLLFVGRIDPVKGLDVLFEALCQLLRGLDPRWQRRICLAVIGGDAGSVEALREEAICLDEVKERYGLKEMVAFLGSRSQDTLPYYYAAADACVMPSLYESFGLVALEAMACGTPVVASRVGGLPYVVRDGETGLLVPDSDPAALAEGLRRVLTEPDLRDRLGARAHEVAGEFSWRRVAAENIDLYRQVLAAREASAGQPRHACTVGGCDGEA
jgi:D-inositol-3-phosphate glycosyltransferase